MFVSMSFKELIQTLTQNKTGTIKLPDTNVFFSKQNKSFSFHCKMP